jgi:putative transposase
MYGMAMVNRKATYRLYPSAKQEQSLFAMFVLHQGLYNVALEQRISVYQSHHISLNFAQQCKELTELRAAYPEYAALNAQSCQVTLKRVDLAFQHFFYRLREGKAKAGFPRFKSGNRFSGWGYKSYGDGWSLISNEKMKHGKLRLSGIGHIKIRGKARTIGTPKTCEIMHKNGKWNGKWYASITLECEPQRQAGELAAGLDWGVAEFATLAFSDGTYQEIANPRFLHSSQKELKAAQRDLSRKQKGSHNYHKARQKVAKIHTQIAHRRNNFIHQQTAALIAMLCLIATETLHIKAMTANGGKHKSALNREILNTAPAKFLSTLQYKAAEANGGWWEVPTRKVKPSQTCSNCGAQAKKKLSERHHHCPECGYEMGRDRNAARVMLNWALSATGKELARQCGVGSAGLSREVKTKLPTRKHETPPIVP